MRRTLAALAATALALAACDASWLQQRGLRIIREVSAGEGARLLEDSDAVLLQVRGASWEGLRVEGTELVAARDPLPKQFPARAARAVILAENAEEGLRLAARLSRAGLRDVVVVRGGVAAWQAARRDVPAEREDRASGRSPGEPT